MLFASTSRRIFTVILGAGLCTSIFLLPPHRDAAQPQRKHGVENAQALGTFFKALEELKSGRRLEPVRIAHYGDSHAAADLLTADIRHQFQRDFGDGGPGFVMARNPFSTPRHDFSSGATSGWVVDGIGKNGATDGMYGLAGISLTATKSDERMWIETVSNHFEVYYLRWPGGGTIDIMVDGASVLDAPLSLKSDSPGPDYFAYDTPANSSHRVEIRTIGSGRTRILGIVAEQIAPGGGISYDVLGINGARLSRQFSWNPDVFVDNVIQRKPDLIILAYGTNEVTDVDWTIESYTHLMVEVLNRFRRALPYASIIIFGPPDRADTPVAGSKMPQLLEAQRRAAREFGAAFWSSYDAMGGAGSMNNWLGQGLAQGDHVHLTKEGYLKMGDMFYEDLMKAYAESKVNARAPIRR